MQYIIKDKTATLAPGMTVFLATLEDDFKHKSSEDPYVVTSEVMVVDSDDDHEHGYKNEGPLVQKVFKFSSGLYIC